MSGSLRLGGLAAVATLAAVVGASSFATPAAADTISAELIVGGTINGNGTVTGGSVINLGSSSTGSFNFNQTGNVGSGTYTANVSGTGSPPLLSPDLLETNTLDLQTNGLASGTTLALIITETGLTSAPPGFASSFDVLALHGGTYTGYTMYNGSELASDGPLTGPAGNFTVGTPVTPTSSYTLAAEYTGVTTSTSGNINADIDISATPVPAALPLFAGGLGMLGMVLRRRKRTLAAI